MADVLAVRDEYRAQNWAMVIQECSNSGLSNREFCRQRGISEKTLTITGFGNSAVRWLKLPYRSWFSWSRLRFRRICSRSSTVGQS